MSQGLLKSRKFWPIFWTQFCGAFNDNFLKNAILYLFTFRAAEAIKIPTSMIGAVAGGIFILPFFLFSATSGQIADRYEKAKVIWWIKICEILIMILAGIGLIIVSPVLLFTCLFLMGVHSTFFGPIKYSILPQLLDSHELLTGNGLVEMGTFIAILLGSIAGGELIAVEGGGTKWTGAGMMMIAIIGWLCARKILTTRAADPNLKINWNPVNTSFRILMDTTKEKSVFYSILGISWFWFYGAAFLYLFPGYTKEILAANEQVGVLSLATFSIGIALGSVLCAKISKGELELGFVPVGSFGMSLFALDLFFVGKPWPISPPEALEGVRAFLRHPVSWRIVFDQLMIAISSGFFTVPLYTLMQLRTKEAERSQIIAGNNLWNSLFLVLSSIVLILFLKLNYSIPQMFLIIAVLNFIVALFIYTLIPEFLYRLCAWVVANLLYRFKAYGVENIPKEGAAILVCNHVSFIDWLFISAAIRRPIRFVMEDKYADMWILRSMFQRAKVIPISPDRLTPKAWQQAFDKVALELQSGSLVCLFPEGRITKTGEMNDFRSGVERILERAPVPVIPLAIDGIWGSIFSRAPTELKFLPGGKLFAKIRLNCGQAIPAQNATAEFLQSCVSELLEDLSHTEYEPAST